MADTQDANPAQHHEGGRLLLLGSNPRWIADVTSALAAHVSAAGGEAVRVINTLTQVRAVDPADFAVVLCAPRLPDGDVLTAVRCVQERRDDLPFVMVGGLRERSALLHGVAVGATDAVVLDELRRLPFDMLLRKWTLMQRSRHDDERVIRRISRKLSEQGLKNRRLRDLVEQLEHKARTDDLTGLFNRRWLGLVLEGAWAEACRNDLPLAFIMADLDMFKRFNDYHGHYEGDRVLQLAANVIRANCREVDLVARYGGDEFCVLMPHTMPDDALEVARRVAREFDLAVSRHSPSHPVVAISLGVAHIDCSAPLNAEQLLVHADEAMYAAKALAGSRALVRRREGVRAA